MKRPLTALLVVSLLLPGLAADGREPALEGSISRQEWARSGRPGEPWAPTDKTVLDADLMTRQWQLDAAEELYKDILTKHPESAGAWHGLGLVNYYRTTTSNPFFRDRRDELFHRAIDNFHHALRFQPHYVDAQLDLARVYMDQGRWPEAREYVSKAMGLDPEHAGANALAGRLMVEDGDFNSALPYLRKAVELDSGNHRAHFDLGRVHRARGEYYEAHRELQTALYQYPNSAPVQFELGQLYEEQGNSAAAIGAYEKALMIKPEYLPACEQLAGLYERRGDSTLALAHYKNALGATSDKFSDEYRELSLRVADKALRSGDLTTSTMVLTDVLRRWPFDPQAVRKLAEVSLARARETTGKATGLMDEARGRLALEQSLVLDPTRLDAQTLNVSMNGESRSLEEIPATVVDAAMGHVPQTAGQSIARGEVWTARYDYDRALREYETAITGAKNPREAVAVGEMLMTLGQPELALRAFSRARSGDLVVRKAARLGKKKARRQQSTSQQLVREARQVDHDDHYRDLLEQALRKNNRNSDAHLLLGHYHYKRDDYVSAIRHYHAYTRLEPAAKETRKLEKRLMHLAEKLSEQQRKASLSGVR